jgi:hypothetical protein
MEKPDWGGFDHSGDYSECTISEPMRLRKHEWRTASVYLDGELRELT